MSRRGSGGGDWTADTLQARSTEANGAEAIDVAGRRFVGLLDVEGAVDVEGLDVEAMADSRGGGVVDAACEAQVVHTLTQVLDDGEPQGALRAAVHNGLALCGELSTDW